MLATLYFFCRLLLRLQFAVYRQLPHAAEITLELRKNAKETFVTTSGSTWLPPCQTGPGCSTCGLGEFHKIKLISTFASSRRLSALPSKSLKTLGRLEHTRERTGLWPASVLQSDLRPHQFFTLSRQEQEEWQGLQNSKSDKPALRCAKELP